MENANGGSFFKEYEMRALCEEGGRAYLKAYFAEEDGKQTVSFDKEGYTALAEAKIRNEEELLIFISGFCDAYIRAEDCLLGPEDISFSKDSVFIAENAESSGSSAYDVRLSYIRAEEKREDDFGNARAFLKAYLNEMRDLDSFGSIRRLTDYLEHGPCTPVRLKRYAGELRRELRLNAF